AVSSTCKLTSRLDNPAAESWMSCRGLSQPGEAPSHMSAAETGSLYFEGVPLALQDTMWRVGAGVHPAEFVERVVETFRAVEVVAEEEVQARFRASRPYADFVGLLRAAARPGLRIIVIGCGRGLAGRSSAYAASVVRETLDSGEIGAMDCVDLIPGCPPEARVPYDLVVTHSLLHFLLDPTPVCRLLL